MRKLDKGNEARRVARDKADKPRATQRIPDKCKVDPCVCDEPQLRCPIHDDEFTDEELGL